MDGDEELTPESQAEGAPEADFEAEADAHSTALPPRVENWRRRSAAGAILTGFALGLQEALDPHKDEPRIVVQTSGDPPRDLPVEADFEYGRPRQSVVNIRPWLLDSDKDASRTDRHAETGAGGAEEPEDGE